MKMQKSVILAGLLFGLSGCGDSEPPIKMESYDNIDLFSSLPYAEVAIIAIIAIVDEVVIANRGNCKISAWSEKILPHALKYGDVTKVTFVTQCSISQVGVLTDQGNWSVSYN